MGHSSISQAVGNLKQILWETIIETQEDQQAGLLLIIGAPHRQSLEDDMSTHLPQFGFYEADTNGSNMLVAWHEDIWKDLSVETVDLCGATDERKALALTLRRATAQGSENDSDAPPLADEDPFVIVITKFHQGKATTGHSFDAHKSTRHGEQYLG